MNKDIEILQASLDRSIDEVFMFLHTIIHSFVENDSGYAGKYLSENNWYLRWIGV